jgi:hypothetical protein
MNREKEHVLFLPEDRANEQLLNGFLRALPRSRPAKVLNTAGGWLEAARKVERLYSASMRRYPRGFLVLVIDFDGNADRREEVLQQLPGDLRDRVFVIGVLKEPEDLKRRLNTTKYEVIGKRLAEGCPETFPSLWNEALLVHNTTEIERMRASVLPILFGTE